MPLPKKREEEFFGHVKGAYVALRKAKKVIDEQGDDAGEYIQLYRTIDLLASTCRDIVNDVYGMLEDKAISAEEEPEPAPKKPAKPEKKPEPEKKPPPKKPKPKPEPEPEEDEFDDEQALDDDESFDDEDFEGEQKDDDDEGFDEDDTETGPADDSDDDFEGDFDDDFE